ncbi:MAG: hypothetical protein WC969_00750 [Elusimicrobiota bacterium]
MSSKNDDVVAAAIGAGVGATLFYSGFQSLRLKRLVEAIATSKVRSMAMGTVELCGKADALEVRPDPIYGQDAVCWRIVIEEHRGSGKNSRWVTIHTADNTGDPFWFIDETGRVLVQPGGADKRYKVDASYGTGLLSGAPPEIAAYIRAVVGDSWSSRRLNARILRPGDPLYILGSAMPLDERPPLHRRAARAVKLTLQDAVRRLKGDAAKMRALDANGDGMVDPQEWDAGVRELQDALAKADAAPPDSPSDAFIASAVVRQGDAGTFVVADETESELLGELGWSAWLMILGGPILCVACVAYLAVRLHVVQAE